MHFLWRNRLQWAGNVLSNLGIKTVFFLSNGQKTKTHVFLQWFPNSEILCLQISSRYLFELNQKSSNMFNWAQIRGIHCKIQCGNHCRKPWILFFCPLRKNGAPYRPKLQKSTSAHWWRFRPRKCIYGQHFFEHRSAKCHKIMRHTLHTDNTFFFYFMVTAN